MSIEFLPRNNFESFYKVATVDATNKEKDEAQVVLDGVNDQIKINELIQNLQSSRGGTIMVGAGKLYTSGQIIIDGKGSTSTPTINLIGTGNQSTIINCQIDTDGIICRNAFNGKVEGFGFEVDGTSTGFEVKGGNENGNFSGVGIRGCYNSEFRNLTVKGADTHTGVGIKLGNHFRSVFDNIEGFNLKNGMRVYAQSDLFNPGDCTFGRLFMEVQGGAGTYAYLIDSDVPNSSTTFVGQINQCLFNSLQGVAQSDGATGLKLDGKWAVQNNTFGKIGLQEFQTVIDNVSSDSNEFKMDYCTTWTGSSPLPNQKMIKSGIKATKNVYEGNNAFIDQAITYIEDNSQSLATRNIYEKLSFEAGTNANIGYSGTSYTQITQSMVTNISGGTVDPAYNASF
jgi:hypothetical protein